MTCIFQRGFLVGLYSVPLILEFAKIENAKIEKRITQRVRSYYSYKMRLWHKLRVTNLSYLSKNKKRYKKFALQFAVKFVINISSYDEEASGCAFHFVKIYSKTK